ncbi:MAG: undecaprenyl-diphosphate phosphatase [Rubrobacteraceae bacterium]
MPDTIEALLLGLLQGTTEFLPISSSAHLVLGQYFFGMDRNRFGLPFDMVLQLGTLVAVVWFYRLEVAGMTRALFRSLSGPDFSDPEQRLAYLLILATTPAAVVGYLFRDFFVDTLRSPWVVVGGFAFSGVLFLAAEWFGKKRGLAGRLTFGWGAFIGLGQAISLLYGVSRSGSTMAFGLFAGLERTEAARFSFLLSIPISLAAIASQVPDLTAGGLREGALALFGIGFVSAAVTAYVSIKFLLAFFTRYSLRPFAYYVFAAAAGVAVALSLGA